MEGIGVEVARAIRRLADAGVLERRVLPIVGIDLGIEEYRIKPQPLPDSPAPC